MLFRPLFVSCWVTAALLAMNACSVSFEDESSGLAERRLWKGEVAVRQEGSKILISLDSASEGRGPDGGPDAVFLAVLPEDRPVGAVPGESFSGELRLDPPGLELEVFRAPGREPMMRLVAGTERGGSSGGSPGDAGRGEGALIDVQGVFYALGDGQSHLKRETLGMFQRDVGELFVSSPGAACQSGGAGAVAARIGGGSLGLGVICGGRYYACCSGVGEPCQCVASGGESN